MSFNLHTIQDSHSEFAFSTDSLEKRISCYQNTADHNDALYLEFTQLTHSIDFLSTHRQYVELRQLGYGDPAFHYMWFLLLRHLAHASAHAQLLEIGVFKGQVISLWTLISAKLNQNISVTGISPLEGYPVPKSKWLKRWKYLTSSKFRQDLMVGNFHPQIDYREAIHDLFKAFELPLSNVRLVEGYSSDPNVLSQMKDREFSLVYIDGDHSYTAVKKDIANYARLVEPNGFLVMDDACCDIPGSVFWKGLGTVTRACRMIPDLGFINVLNIGHNRIFQKKSQ